MAKFNIILNEEIPLRNSTNETAVTIICVKKPSFHCDINSGDLCPFLNILNSASESDPTHEQQGETVNNLEKHHLPEKQPKLICSNIKEPGFCSVCNNTFKCKESLRKYTQSHLHKCCKCSLCEFTSKPENALQQHKIVHHQIFESAKMSCPLCNFKTKKKRNLKKHIARHVTDKNHACNICNYRTRNLYYLKRHLKNHVGERDLKCSICEFETVHKSSLRDHVQKHQDGKKFECKICDFKTTSKKQLNQHAKSHSESFKRIMDEYTAKFKSRSE